MCNIAIAQVEVKPSEVNYKRVGAQPDYKKTFRVRYPVVTGIESDVVNKKIYAALDYWKLFDISLAESLNDYFWLDDFDYKVNYLGNGILDISLYMEGSGAYPDTVSKTIVLNLKNGNRLSIANEFKSIGRLVAKIDAKQQAEIKKAISETEPEEDFGEYLKNRQFGVNTLNEFSVSDKGVTFLYDYGFPKAIRALEPPGRYFFTWYEITPHIKQSSALEVFLKTKTQ